MKIILHAGFHKTGSTSIQATLATTSAPGFRYLTVKPANHSNLLSSAFRTRSASSGQPDPDAPADFGALLDAAVAGFAGDTIIISGEVVSVFARDSLQALRAELSRVTDDISVIGYVRPVADYMSSQFQQDLKNRFVAFDQIKTRPYKRQIDDLEAAFGQQNVSLIPFDRATLRHGDVVRDFCDRIGFAIDPAAIRRTNESLGAEGIALLYLHRKYYDAPPARRPAVERDFIQHLRATAGTGRFVLDGSVIAAANAGCRDDMRAVSERIGYPFEKFLDASKPGIRNERELLETVLSEDYQRAVLPAVTGKPFDRHLAERELAAALEQVRIETDRPSSPPRQKKPKFWERWF